MPAPGAKGSDVPYKPCESSMEQNIEKKSICNRFVALAFIVVCTIVGWGVIFHHFIYNPRPANIISPRASADYEVMPPVGAACSNIPDDKKFDCFPRGKPDQDTCTSRGCCWAPKESNNLNVPTCFYPTNFQSYKVVQVQKLKGGVNVILNITRNSIYPKDVKSVSMKIIFETESRLHVKVRVYVAILIVSGWGQVARGLGFVPYCHAEAPSWFFTFFLFFCGWILFRVIQDIHSLRSLLGYQSNCEGTKEKILIYLSLPNVQNETQLWQRDCLPSYDQSVVKPKEGSASQCSPLLSYNTHLWSY